MTQRKAISTLKEMLKDRELTLLADEYFAIHVAIEAIGTVLKLKNDHENSHQPAADQSQQKTKKTAARHHR